MTEIVLKGSVKVWKESFSHEFALYKSGQMLITRPFHNHKKIESPSLNFFNNNKLLMQYADDTWTIEYTRSYLPIWMFTSFVSNIICLDFISLIQIFSAFFNCISLGLKQTISNFIVTTHECCSQPFWD